MGSFTYPTNNNQPAPGSAAFKAKQILDSGSQTLPMLAQRRIQNYMLFWSDPIAIAIAFGVKATGVFKSDAALVAFLGPELEAAGAPADVITKATAGIPDKWVVQYNDDGSVIITPAPEKSS